MTGSRKEPALASVLRHLLTWANHHAGGSAEDPEPATARMTVHRSDHLARRAVEEPRR